MFLFVIFVWLYWFLVTMCITLFLLMGIAACMLVSLVLRLCKRQGAARAWWAAALWIAELSDAINRPMRAMRERKAG